MAGPIVDFDRVAMILVEAMFYGDTRTAKRWNRSITTICRYRKMANADSDLAKLVAIKKQRFEADWIEEIPAALRAGIRFLTTAFQELDYNDPANIHAAAGAMKILADIGLSKEMLDVRYSHLRNSAREENREMVGGYIETTANSTD